MYGFLDVCLNYIANALNTTKYSINKLNAKKIFFEFYWPEG